MKAKIIYLSNQLRDKGLNVSIRSTQTALDTCEIIGVNDLVSLKRALRSVYVKDKYDMIKFDEIFDQCFIKPPLTDESKKVKKNSNMNAGKAGGKSNKYVIKKKNAKVHKKPNKMGMEQIKQLSGTPVLDDRENLEREGELLNKDLTKLNKFDPRMLELCQQLGRRIANKRSRRNKLAKTNKVDIRRTMRKNIKYGGVPVELIKAKPKRHKNEHLFLNDISGSCEWISSWFFMLMYSCQTAFKNSRVFEFDNKVIETTDALKQDYLLNAFADVRTLRMRNAMVHGTSNMYSAFNLFKKQAKLNNKSYVVLLSDCRDWAGPKIDGIPASVEVLQDIVRDSKKVVILNPEDKNKWDVVDSCVSLYENVGAKVFEVSTLNQLADFVVQM
ncbi:MAG: VWA domain-containing protein [Methanobacteriaceae archaeon]|jgi:hypothetical protein|uniref:VWA domain-containing protein n=1 Tax=unclassified Methanobrevibacter TaxID=2638681 RepID=UPI00376651AB|nr:VWA domain-containing protein [Methanobacteriaceae archaeon]MDD4593612.1 VWA domain-containing protein [Methanobacteriaceae archaeon]